MVTSQPNQRERGPELSTRRVTFPWWGVGILENHWLWLHDGRPSQQFLCWDVVFPLIIIIHWCKCNWHSFRPSQISTGRSDRNGKQQKIITSYSFAFSKSILEENKTCVADAHKWSTCAYFTLCEHLCIICRNWFAGHSAEYYQWRQCTSVHITVIMLWHVTSAETVTTSICRYYLLSLWLSLVIHIFLIYHRLPIVYITVPSIQALPICFCSSTALWVFGRLISNVVRLLLLMT